MNLRRAASRLSVAALAFAIIPIGLAAPQRAAARTDPGTTESNITRVTAGILESSQFSHQSFDDALAGAFLSRYLDTLDSTRSLFLQSDIAEFARYRPTLVAATLDAGDTSLARAVFARLVQRLSDRTAYVTETLRTATFDFTGHDVYTLDPEHTPWPRDVAAARDQWLQQLRVEYLQAKLSGMAPEKIVRTISHRHEQQLATMRTMKNDDVLELYLNALAHVYDPHSDYLGHEEMESLSIQMSLSLFGIGATLESADGACKVRELVPGGPADRGGVLKPGDRIVAVAQSGQEPVDITNLPLSRAVELIRGPKGSRVTLSVVPAGAPEGSPPRPETIVRQQVKLEDQEAKARIIEVPGANGARQRLGVIDLPSFYAGMGESGGTDARSATADVARLLKKLNEEHVRGIVLDLRHNPGGSLQEAVNMTGLFIRKGPVVQTRNEAGEVDVEEDTDPAIQYDGPLVVLTSRFSASASEIVAGALQDYGRAVVVGDSATFGKGTVQTVLPLARVMDRFHLGHSYDPGALKLTISKFYRPSGASTQLRGVLSDVVIPSTSDVSGVSESALKDALPWDTIQGTRFDTVDRVAAYAATLRERSAARVGADRRFAEMKDEMSRVARDVAAKTVSLNEQERRDELAQAKARQKARETEDRASQESSPTTYLITLKNARQPGLPPPQPRVTEHAPTPAPEDDGADPPARRSGADDLILNEALHVLGDYVGLVSP